MFGPSWLCASGIDSRRCHSACDCVRLSATTASSMHAGLQRGFEQRFEARARLGLALVVRLLQQHRPRRPAAAAGAGREVPRHQVQREAVHHLEAGEPGAQARLRQAEQRHALLQRAGARPARCATAAGCGLQLQRRRGDDAQRAFAADEQVAQVVAGVVLAQARQAVPDLRRRRSPPPAPGTARAHCRSAAPACRRRWWPGCRRWCSCLRRPGSAGTAGRRRPRPAAPPAARSRPRPSASGWRVDAAHAVQARQAQQHLRAAGIGHAAADQAGVAALRHDARAVRRAGAHAPPPPRRCRPGARRPAPAAEALAPVQLIGRQVAVASAPGRRRHSARKRVAASGVHAAAASRAARCRRQRTCSAQATNSSRHSSTSSAASAADSRASVAARTTPSAK